MDNVSASVLIATKSRKEELRLALRSVAHQSIPVELIVLDDGSTDGTAEMVRAEFPQVHLIRHEESRGLIVRRNEGAQLAKANIIFSIDDDAAFSSRRVVEQTLQEFSDPRIGAVAIPYVEPNSSSQIRQSAPDSSGTWVTDRFVGTAHAVRRDVFLQIGGYRSELIHQGEERDFCLRMLNLGWVVRLGSADPICHCESPRRSSERMDFYGRRNDIIFAWQNVPMPYLPFHLAATLVRGSVYAVRSARNPQKMFAGMLSGLAECFRGDFERRPVDSQIYRLSRELKKHGPLPFQIVIDRLPAIAEA